MPDVLCLGEFLIDHVSTATNVSLAQSPGFTRAPGGAPANVAVAVQRLGLSAGFVGKVGADPFGDFLEHTLAVEGVGTTSLFRDPAARTTAVFVGVWEDGRKEMCFYRNPGADMNLHPNEIDAAMFEGVRAFHCGSIGLIDEPCASAQRKATRIALDRGLLVSYDPNYRPTLWPDEATASRVIQAAFETCHLAKISAEEWRVATGYDYLDTGIKAVLARGVELLVISRGADGAAVTNGDYFIEIPALTGIDVVETTGAGDGFMGAMIVQLLPFFEQLGSLKAIPEATVRASLDFANAVGALTCTKAGAIPALPTRAEVERFLASCD